VADARPTLALLIICHDRQAELEHALASVAPQGFDEVIVADMASSTPLHVPEGVRLVRSERNLGVAGGRNLLVGESDADVVVFLDDDAVLAAGAGDRLRERLSAPDAAALVAFRITRPDGEERWEQPFRFGRPVPAAATPCSYFVGAGHAIRRSAFLEVGGYDDRLFYATQELDLSFKLMKAGHELVYDPAIEVEHRPSERGRAPRTNLPAMLLHDRLLVLRAHLPWPAVVPHALAWGALTLRQAVGLRGAGIWWRGLGAGLRAPVVRRPLTVKQSIEVHRRGGRLLY
jgi:GT2 family glycosyltransferase